jgi:hypothetical protein
MISFAGPSRVLGILITGVGLVGAGRIALPTLAPALLEAVPAVVLVVTIMGLMVRIVRDM